MSDPLAITDEDAQGLTRLAQAQLRLALRLSERAEAAPDIDAACRLARASERVARGYRQSLLLKSRLQGERRVHRREEPAAAARPAPAPPPPSAELEARLNHRVRRVHAAVERILRESPEALDPVVLDDMRAFLVDALDVDSSKPGFLDEPIDVQIARMCEFLGVAPPQPTGPPDSSSPPSRDDSS